MYLIYDGPSLLDGNPIIVLATGIDRPSNNAKTGPVVQTYIMRKDISPMVALKSGEDSSVCGTCPLRGGSCYVLVHQAPSAIWHSYQKRQLEVHSDLTSLTKGKAVRIGSYGDPAAVPIEVWARLTAKSRSHTGYTHAWRTCDPALKQYCMASVETPIGKVEASTAGWKTFRIRTQDGQQFPGEMLCAAERNEDLTCKLCKVCNGSARDVVITIHGSKWKTMKFTKEFGGVTQISMQQ